LYRKSIVQKKRTKLDCSSETGAHCGNESPSDSTPASYRKSIVRKRERNSTVMVKQEHIAAMKALRRQYSGRKSGDRKERGKIKNGSRHTCTLWPQNHLTRRLRCVTSSSVQGVSSQANRTRLKRKVEKSDSKPRTTCAFSATAGGR
jgi:hypothetical protein